MADRNGNSITFSTAMLTKLLPWFVLFATVVGGWTSMSYRIRQVELMVAENRLEIKEAKIEGTDALVRLARIELSLEYVRSQIDEMVKQRGGAP